MGFARKTYKLVWPEESRWHGLEVRLRGMDFDELESISKLQGDEGVSGIERARPVLDILGNAILSWNLEDEDGAPIDISEFRKQDMAMLLAIVNTWVEVAGDVAPPLKPASSNGEKLEEASLPMVIPSSSHPNLSMQN